MENSAAEEGDIGVLSGLDRLGDLHAFAVHADGMTWVIVVLGGAMCLCVAHQIKQIIVDSFSLFLKYDCFIVCSGPRICAILNSL